MPKVLVANRGEIAIRILRSARELGWNTVAIYTDSDVSHAAFADEAIKLKGVEDFLDIDKIVNITARSCCTHLHPGYGFLSENAALPLALVKLLPTVIFIGPSPDTLRIASDKMLSRDLALSLNINIAPGARVFLNDDVRAFAQTTGFPIMIKALDGGGGRGIRVVTGSDGIDENFKRCLGESSSRKLFVEKALTGPGWKHIEVQIIGDGTGAVNHFWERECSIQRRFQKVVEVAPSRLARSIVRPLLDASLKIARQLKYKGLGTFEYLVNTQSHEWVFLEINPRVQVEHTITEEIVDIDLVRTQFLLFWPSATLASLSLDSPPCFPNGHAVQLRLTAEDPGRGFQLSPGVIHRSAVTWPAGRGVRVDTWLATCSNVPISEWTVGSDFDSLLAKIIVRAHSFEEMSQKARRALRETSLGRDTKTNIVVLAGVIEHPDWKTGEIDTLWLERNVVTICDIGKKALEHGIVRGLENVVQREQTTVHSPASGLGRVLLQPGSLFHLEISPAGNSPNGTPSRHALTLASIAQNGFPENLSGTLQTTFSTIPMAFTLSQSSSTTVSSSAFELADPNNPKHVALPFTGKVVELHPALIAAREGGTNSARRIKKGDTLVVITIMKMENVLVASCDGIVDKVGKGVQVGVIMGEGTLVCIVGDSESSFSKL